MKLEQLFQIVGLTGVISILSINPVLSQEIQFSSILTEKRASEQDNSLGLTCCTTEALFSNSFGNVLQKRDFHQLHQISSPIDFLAQTRSIVRVTNVKLNRTEQGIEIILETPSGEQLQPQQKIQGNRLIAEITGAQLQLSSDQPFRAEKPVEGISEVFVSNRDEKTIEIVVTGDSAAPQVELFDTDSGLIFGFTPSPTLGRGEQGESRVETPGGQIISVTGVQLNPTETGIELILQTPTGVAELLQPNDISSGNNFIVEIPNAQLQLPDGKPFAQSNPIEGIREVTVTNFNASTIRVSAIGETARPQIELFDSDSGLIFAFTPVEDSAQTPSTPPESGQIVSINRVQLNPTETGFEIILLTPKGAAQQLRVVNVSEGNNFIAEITGAQLQLPDGQPYRSENPIEGVSEVTVTNQNENTVRVIAIGEEKQPTVELFDSEDGLIFSAVGDAPSAQGEEDIEIVVTAEKRSELLLETASSITVLTQEQIEDGQINRIEDVAANTPNFSVLGTGSRYFSNFTIRGQSNPTIGEGAVGFYVDGVPITDAYSANIDLFDLEQVEVLRGPQGTLYGRNTSGGVINITTEKPNNQQSLKVSSSFGNFSSTLNQLAFNQPLSENLFVRLSGSYGSREGFIESTTLDRDLDDRSDLALRAQMRWQPTPQWNIDLSASYDLYNDGQQLLVPFNSRNPFQVDYDEEGQLVLKTNTQSLSVVYENSSLKFTSISARRYWEQDPYEIDGDYSALPLLVGLARDDQINYSQEFRLQSNNQKSPWQWTVGLFLGHQERNVDIGFRVLPDAVIAFGAPEVGENLQLAELDSTTVALFGQTTYNFNEKFSLTAGLRYEHDSRSMNRRRVFRSDSGEFPLTPEIDVEESWDQFLPSLVAEYRFSEQLFGYGKIARGYKGGGFSYATDNPDFVRFDPETSWSYELGLKSSWFNDRLLANLSVFYTQVDNYQIDRAVDQFSTVVFNASEVDIYGAELELRVNPLDGFDIIAGFGYTNATFGDFIDPVNRVNLDNNRVIFTPEFSYNLALQYSQPQGGFFGRLELVGSGVVYFNELNTLKQDPYILLNATVGYEFSENFGVYLYGRNLLDTEYFISAVDFGQSGILGAVGEPRTWGVRVRARF